MSKHHKKIEQLNGEISRSGLEQQHKTYAIDVLAEVDEITNGHTDKIQGITDAMLALTGYMIRRDIFLQDTHAKQMESMQKMVASHADTCPLADQIPDIVIEAMKAEAVKEDGSRVASVSGHGVKAKSDPLTARIIAIAAVICFMCATYIVKTIVKGG
jgi:hypothetical protein